MSFLARRAGAVLLVLVGLLASLVLVGVSPATADNGTAVGRVIATQQGKLRVKVLWFDNHWKYLGQRKLDSDIYRLSLAPGTYHLQFVDLRPSYDVTKYAPSDIQVTVPSGLPVQHDVKMRRGAAITGVARGGGHVLRGARIVAANANQQSYETKANSQGQFALGGLPDGNYSLFTFDRDQTWVAKSLWVPKMKRPEVRNLGINLKTKGGSLLVSLFKPDGKPMGGRFYVTVVSKASGQFWTARAGGGSVTFQGLYPGRYKLVAPGVGNYLARTGSVVGGYVKAGGADLASTFKWTQRGAWITGIVVDYEDPSIPIAKVPVSLYDASGNKIGQDTTNDNGLFTFAGQLDTQDGLTVVATGGWYQGDNYCNFKRTSVGDISVTHGMQTDMDALEMRHAPADDQAGATLCYPSDGS
ncbi:collagen binding domain-containing protein [Nocardioides sp. LS1]|uniref:MSCRAMM family protein n=1 Tax=Nocardioides sp. LS1 TaxID=1027620 RepID=UPI000F6203AF|nr:hypothetical protein [Nocardioides sp. LS1]GCD90819.1 hypothetical protein NLS1_28250 [Nocardioides sp. LS1]